MSKLTPKPGSGCRRICVEWKDLINFLQHVPYYQLADRCKSCLIWFPKNMIVKCPCCHQRVRSTPKHRKTSYLPEAETKEIIRKAMANGWTLLKNDEFVKNILEYENITQKYKRLK